MKTEKRYPQFDNCNPSTCISGRLMKMNRIIANIFRKHLSPFNITDSQLSMLFVVGKMGGANQKQIADFMFLEKSTVNRNLKRLVKDGYLESGGTFNFVLTKDGHELLEKIIPHWKNAMKEAEDLMGKQGGNALDILTKKLITL